MVVEPMKPCYVREIEGLKAMQEIVGGHIEAIYPFKEQVAIIANEKGKLMGLPYNRPLLDENGVPYPAPIMAERMISPIFGRLSWRCCEQRGSPPWSPPVFGRMTTVSRRICWPRQKSSRDGE